MMGGNDANDPWGMREEPDEIQGLGNMEIRQQQQHIIRGMIILITKDKFRNEIMQNILNIFSSSLTRQNLIQK